MNTFGHILKLTTFGESHGPAIGGVLDGFPAGIFIDFDFIKSENARRKPGASSITSERKEADEPEFISGIFENVSTGAPIAFIIKNKDSKSQDYDLIKELYRPSHADFTYQQKYGIRDYRGGGRASARETACRVTAGALAKLMLKELGITIQAFVQQVGNIKCEIPYTELDLNNTEKNAIRCPDLDTANKMIALIEQIRDEGDSIGGTIFCVIKNAPIGLGSPIYAKLQADLGSAMLGINASKGFDYGSGFNELHKKGSEQNDEFIQTNRLVQTKTNHSGGIQGGISNGNDIYFRVAFKAVSTIKKEQNTVDLSGNSQIMKAEGRHDPCVLPRAVPIVEAMAALVLADHWLLNKTSKFNNI